MTALLKLKRFFTIDEAAQRLSASCGSAISPRDIYQLVLQGELPLAAYISRQHAREVAPVTMLRNWYPELKDDPTWLPTLGRDLKTGATHLSRLKPPPSHWFEIEKQTDEVLMLDGVFLLWLQGPHYLNYVQWLAAGREADDFDMISLDGVCVHGEDGTLLQPVNRTTGHPDSWHPITYTPDPCDFRVLVKDLLRLESDALAQPQGTSVTETPLHGKERAHYLKVIAALLSKAKISKSEPVTQVLTILEAAGQTSINRETLGKTLNDANALRL